MTIGKARVIKLKWGQGSGPQSGIISVCRGGVATCPYVPICICTLEGKNVIVTEPFFLVFEEPVS